MNPLIGKGFNSNHNPFKESNNKGYYYFINKNSINLNKKKDLIKISIKINNNKLKILKVN